jgi:hypothetical protein
MSIWHHDKENRKLVIATNPLQVIGMIVVIVIIGIVAVASHI